MLVTVDSFRDAARRNGTPIRNSARRVLVEWDKIGAYKAKGFIAEWPT